MEHASRRAIPPWAWIAGGLVGGSVLLITLLGFALGLFLYTNGYFDYYIARAISLLGF